jgi:hypothetical protein
MESGKPRDLQGFRYKRMKGFEPSTFAMANREMRPETRKLARFDRLNMAYLGAIWLVCYPKRYPRPICYPSATHGCRLRRSHPIRKPRSSSASTAADPSTKRSGD